jgi:gamma-glutamyltranspeptidase/glutathione hydrolase
VFQVLADVYDYDLPLPKALAELRFHHQLLPENTIFSEPYAPFGAGLTKALAERGYKVENQDFNGDIEAIRIVGGMPQPASDPRQRGVSMVVR